MFLRTRLLWARISATPSIRTKVIDIHLRRSGARAFNIGFVGWRDIPDSFHRPQHFDCILNSLLVSAHRWRSIYVSDMCDALLMCPTHALCDYPTSKFSVLKAIVFHPQHLNSRFSFSCLLSCSLESMDVVRATGTAIDFSVFRLLISGAPTSDILRCTGSLSAPSIKTPQMSTWRWNFLVFPHLCCSPKP
ncbi:hypothetical protein PAXRUDRAFT_698694 [Paxillus rubicundulus Ve08.2h10]|uniref:Uncharacterized protein n=1 Tax=Paxillus rubicundulus Ve08.2h10 TaxID=930991 RepID=A0A0D0D7F4_9AGAM|nr:hypothetical protein PAXRUDRAFT_698694 [Paxillus rubicundulus Ve08.2h10]